MGAAVAISAPLGLELLLPPLVAAGLKGIECYDSGCPPEVTRDLLGLAARHGLVPTGGSDHHGPGCLSVELGEVDVPLSAFDPLKALPRK